MAPARVPTAEAAARWGAVERWLVALIALHSYAVGFCLLFLTRWGAAFGGFGEVTPLFFARQAGIFHFVLATAYVVEYVRYRGIVVLLVAKATAFVFLTVLSFAEPLAWAIPLSAVGDSLMGLAAAGVRRRVGRGA